MIGLPTRAPLPVAFVPPVVAVPAANAIVPFALPAAAGGGSVAGPAAAVGALAAGVAAVAGSPVVASIAVGFGAGLLIGAALLAAAQLWGRYNGTRRTAGTQSPGITVTGNYSPTQYTELVSDVLIVGLQETQGTCVEYNAGQLVQQPAATMGLLGFRVLKEGTTSGTCGGVQKMTLQFQRGDGSWAGIIAAQAVPNGSINRVVASISTSSSDPSALPANSLSPEPLPLPDRPDILRNIRVATATPQPLKPLPLVLPGSDPSTSPKPQTEPEVVPVEPGPSRPAVPAVTPARPPVIAPWLLPGSPLAPQQTGTDGRPTPVPAPPVPVTDPGSIVPWPGAAPIPGTGPAPRPDLQGIAQEVGKIERKIEMMMNPAAPGNLIDRFGDLTDLIGPVVQAILAVGSGTTYGLDSPCEVDANGDKLPPVLVEAPGAVTQFGAILNRIDALAELLQVHKNLKQPNCKPKQPTGEFVTVNFEQID